jgi:uncharacterized protein DUF4956
MRISCLLVLVSFLSGASALAQVPPPSPTGQQTPADREAIARGQDRTTTSTEGTDHETQLGQLTQALTRLPLAAALACVLALRPRRRGTPPRQLHVIQTQIILAVVGAVVMLVVGSSLARAFGIVGAAGLVRYRAKISDPKDAGVMLATLAVGLGSGVGLWMLATFSTVFVLALLWVLESFEPTARQKFSLKVKAKDPAALKPKLEQLLTRHHVEYELRTASTEELCFEVGVPLGRTDRLSEVILALDPKNATAVEWEEKKEKK